MKRTPRETHDALIYAFLDYFAALEIFEQRPSVPKRRVVRKHLADIMKLAKKRREEIIDSHRDKMERERIARQNQEKADKN